MAGNANSGRRQQPEEMARLKGTFQPYMARPKGITGKKITDFNLSCTHIQGYKSLTERAKSIYKSTCKHVMAYQLLEPMDLPQILIYAKEFDRYLQCDEDIAKRGHYRLRYDESGEVIGTIENPSVNMAKKALDTVIKISSNFGFSPNDRQRLKAEVNPEDPTTKIVNIIMNGNGTEEPDDQ